jgi:hypothetical protein
LLLDRYALRAAPSEDVIAQPMQLLLQRLDLALVLADLLAQSALAAIKLLAQVGKRGRCAGLPIPLAR